MGKRHAAALSAISRGQAEEEVREAETRRATSERERQLLSSYLGSPDQVAGTGEFSGASPDTLKYTQRYSFDPIAVRQIQDAQQSVGDPFGGGQDPVQFAQSISNQANDLLAQSEAAARAGDVGTADRLFAQAQGLIGNQLGRFSSVLGSSFNLGDTAESGAKLRASSNEARIVGRQLLTARELQDPNSATFGETRGRLLDPTLAELSGGASRAAGEVTSSEQAALRAIDEQTRNAERAIASERTQVEGEIRQQAAKGGVGFNARAQLAAKARVASEAALQRAQVYTEAARQSAGVASEAGLTRAQIYERESAARAAATSQVNLYLNEFAKRMAEDSVNLAQEWVSGVAGVRDTYQQSLDQFAFFQAEMSNQWAQIFRSEYQQEKAQEQARKDRASGAIVGLAKVALGAALAPFTGGASLVAAGASAAGDLFGGGKKQPDAGPPLPGRGIPDLMRDSSGGISL